MVVNKTICESVFLAAIVALASMVGGIALMGNATAAENLHDGSLTHPSTGESIYAANSTEKKSITYGYSVDNVTNSGDEVILYLEFPNQVNNSAGKLSSFSGNVTCKCGGNPESIGLSSSASIVDGMDGDGVKETIKIGIQPNKKDKPIGIIVNFTGDATWPDVEENQQYDLKAGVDEPNENIEPTEKFEDITITGDQYAEPTGTSSVGTSSATLEGTLWNAEGFQSTEVRFVYWQQGSKSSTLTKGDFQSVSSTGGFSQSVSGFQSGTAYVFRTDVYNSTTDNWHLGPQETFTTTETYNVTTNSASRVGSSSATLNGDLTGLGGYSSVEVRFVYWEKNNKDSTRTKTDFQSKSSTGTFSDSVSGLKSGTTYVFIANAYNSSNDDWEYGTEKEFKTS